MGVKMEKFNKEDAEKIFTSDNSDKIIDALMYATFNIDDWEWLQNWCLKLLDYPSSDVKGLAATCLGHIARMYSQLDLKKVIPVLTHKLDDREIRGRVEDALEDIAMYIKTQPRNDQSRD